MARPDDQREKYRGGHDIPERRAMAKSCTAENDRTLDNPAWCALTGADRHLSEGGEKARRYKPAVSPLAAVPDEHDPQTWAEMAELAAGSPVMIVTSSGAFQARTSSRRSSARTYPTCSLSRMRRSQAPSPGRPSTGELE
jgi:hypothetical protein